MASLVSEDFHDRKDENERSRGTKDGGKYENPVVGQETLSELKKMFGIHDSSDPNRKGSAKDFAVLLGQASAGRVLRGEDFLHLLSGYVQANLSELRTGILRLSLNTPCLSYLSSLVKKSRSARSNRSRHIIDDNAEQVAAKNRRIVLKLTVMLMELVHLKILSPQKNGQRKMSMPLKIKCNVKMFANLRMLEIHGAELYDLENISFLRDRLEVLYIEGSTVHCPSTILFEPDKVPNPPPNNSRPTPSQMQDYHDSGYIWPRLARIKFSNCLMKMLDRSLAFLPQGRVFDFSRNELDVSSFKALALIAQSSKMSSIDLAFNRLSSCESLLMYLPVPGKSMPPLRLTLQSLSLRHNRISTTAGLEVLTNLQYLDISHNLLSSLEEIVRLQKLELLQSFSLEGNPLALHSRYREEIGKIFLNVHGSETKTKFSLDGKRLRFKGSMLSSSTNMNRGVADGNGSGILHRQLDNKGIKANKIKQKALGFEAAVTDVEATNSNEGIAAKAAEKTSKDRKREKKKQRKRVVTIEDPSALTVPLSPDKRVKKKIPKHSKKGKKSRTIKMTNEENQSRDLHNFDHVNAGRREAANRASTTNNTGDDAWDEMEQYKLRLQKKYEQYHRRLEKKREDNGANWLDSSPREKSSYLHQNQLTQKKSKSHRNSFKKKNGLKSHGSNATHSAKMKSHDVGKLSKRKSHNADLSDTASTSGSSTSTKGSNSTASSASAQKNAKDAEDDTHLLFQREYLAERHYQSQTSDNQSNDTYSKNSNNSITSPPIKTCILFIEGASFVEVDITGGNICEKLSLDFLTGVSLTHGVHGDTLLKITFTPNDADSAATSITTDKRKNIKGPSPKTKNVRDVYYALHQAGTLEELRCLLQARVIYNLSRNGLNGVSQQFVTLQCLSCEYVFEWDTYENMPFKCTRCQTSNLRTTRVSTRRRGSSKLAENSSRKVSNLEKPPSSTRASDPGDQGIKHAQHQKPILDALKWDYFGEANTNESTDKDEASKDGVKKPAISRNESDKKTLDGPSLDSTATRKEEAVEEKHDPFNNLKIHSNLELYFRERVFCSKTERSERVTHLTVIMVAVIAPTIGSASASIAHSTSKKKKNIEGNDIECVVVLTDESLYIMRTLDDKTLQFKDEANFEEIGVYNFKAIKQVVIGFWAQRLVLKTVDGMCFVLLTRNRDKTYAILQKLPSLFEIINEDQNMLESLQKNILKDPSANITLFLMLHRRHKDKKRVMPRTLVLTSSGIYLCEEDYANEWVSEQKKPDSEVPRIRIERYSTIKDIIKLEPSERPTDFTIVVSEMMGIIPRQRRWRLRVDSRAKKAKVLQELRKLIRENI